jgi:hypothetical protein
MSEPLNNDWAPLTIPPLTVMPGIVAVGEIFGHTPDAAVGLSEIHAFVEGCLLHVVAAARRPSPSTTPWGDPDQGINIFARRGGRRSGELLSCAVAFPDGTVVNADDPPGPVVLTRHEGRGSAPAESSRLVYRQPLWLSPLPAGPGVRLVLDWPAYGIHHAAHELDTDRIARAAAGAREFWQH